MSRRPRVQSTLLDRAVAWVSPSAGLSRLKARTMLAAASGYVGARRDRNTTSQWGAAVSSSGDFDTLPDLDVLRARSRDLVRNDPLALSAVSTKVAHVVGAGHVVRPEIDAARLGITPEAAEEWEELALDVWTQWSSSEDCDITRTQNFAALEDLVYRSRLLSGDCFVIFRWKVRPGRLLATTLQVIEADRLSNPNWQTDSATMAGGIEKDEDGAAVAYHFANRHMLDVKRGEPVTWTRVPAYDASGRRQVLHIHGPRWRPDMTRYAPMLAPVIESLKQRSRYSEAELMAAVVSACFAIGLKSPEGDLGDGLIGASGAQTSATGKEINLTEPGQIFDLMPGEEVNSFAPGRPNPQFAPFIDAIAREVGAGTDLPQELLVKQFQASYSASRAAMELAWLFFRAERATHVAQFCLPVYDAVMSEAVARGVLKAPGFFSDALRRQAFLGSMWIGAARPTIDPSKDAVADQAYLDMGVTSLTRIAAERFAVDFRTVKRRRAQDGSDEREKMKANPAPATETEEAESDNSDLEDK